MLHNQKKNESYKKLENIGEGAYGIVYKAVELQTQKIVAIKKIRSNKIDDGINFTALREIKFLKELKHPNVIKLMDVYNHKNNIHLVYEFLDTDLEKIITDSDIILKESDIKSYMKMLFEGIRACHDNWILHRDLKPGNLLISKTTGEMKIGDFGLSRTFGSPNRKYTPRCVTRWYRAPELLYGSEYYGTVVNSSCEFKSLFRAIGCIFAELMLRTAYFPGEDDFDQLGKIFAGLGTPTEKKWPGMKSLPNYVPYEDYPETPFKNLFTAASDDAIDLLSKLLKFNPTERISASDALKHDFFTKGDPPTNKLELPFPTLDLQKSIKKETVKRKRSNDEDENRKVKRKLNLVSPKD